MMIRTSSTGEIMVMIQFYDDKKEERELLLDFLKEEFPPVSQFPAGFSHFQ